MTKKYLILDCETATLDFAKDYPPEDKGKIALAKPLIYDIGWQVVDALGNIYSSRSFLVSEIFFVPSVFQTAYYAEKRPFYLDMLKKGEIEVASWLEIEKVLNADLETISSVGAYNAMFDFKKALPFTKEYIKNLYSDNLYEWIAHQKKSCDNLVNNVKSKYKSKMNTKIFWHRRKPYEIFDLWRLSCETLLNNDEYRNFCLVNGWHSKKFYRTTAETTYRFIKQEENFVESHTALSDVEIECEIFWKIIESIGEDFNKGIISFPFRIVGMVKS